MQLVKRGLIIHAKEDISQLLRLGSDQRDSKANKSNKAITEGVYVSFYDFTKLSRRPQKQVELKNFMSGRTNGLTYRHTDLQSCVCGLEKKDAPAYLFIKHTKNNINYFN